MRAREGTASGSHVPGSHSSLRSNALAQWKKTSSTVTSRASTGR